MKAVFANKPVECYVMPEVRRARNAKTQKSLHTTPLFKTHSFVNPKLGCPTKDIAFHEFVTCSVCGNDYNIMFSACTNCTGVEFLKSECEAEMIDHSLELL